MDVSDGTSQTGNTVLTEILATLKKLQQDHAHLSAAVDTIGAKVDSLSHAPQTPVARPQSRDADSGQRGSPSIDPLAIPKAANGVSSGVPTSMSEKINDTVKDPRSSSPMRRSSVTSRIILTTYPGQAGIDPIPMNWGSANPSERGPVVVSRNQHTIRRRNGTP